MLFNGLIRFHKCIIYSFRVHCNNYLKGALDMRRYVLTFMSLATGLILFLSSCSSKAPGPINTLVIAYPQQAHQLEVKKMSVDTSVYAENVAAYLSENGERQIYIYSAPVESSENALSVFENGVYTGSGRYMQKSLPEIWSSENPMSVSFGVSSTEITPADSGKYTSEWKDVINAFGQSRDTVVYANVFGKGINLNCSLTSFGINTEIVLPKRTEQHTFQIKVKLPDLIPDTVSLDYILFKTALEKGEVKAILYTPLVVDSNEKWSYSNTVKLVDKDSETGIYTVEYEIDEAFLKDSGTKYPVTLNQSIHLYKSKQPDTSAYEKTGDEAGHYLSPYMLLGDETVKGEGWTFIRYETLNNLNIDLEKIVSAKYVFRNLFNLPKEVEIGAYAVTADWCSINTRWFNRPPFDEKPVNTVIVRNSGDYSLDLTILIKEMLKNRDMNDAKYSVRNSFLIRSDSDGSNIILPSGDNGLFSPYLEIVLHD